jgi:excisionase family DNA binding protein
MFYTVAAAAKATGLSKSTILGAIESGRITGTRVSSGEWEIEHSDLLQLYGMVGEPSIGIDGAQQNTAPDAANLEARIEDRIKDVGDSLRQSFDEGHSEPHDGWYQAQASQRLFAGPMHALRSAAASQAREVTSPLPTVLIAGTLLAALGLCWIWGWGSYLFVGLQFSTSLKQDLNSSSPVLGSKDERIGTTPAESSRDTKSGVQYSPTLTTSTAAQPGHARASQDLAQPTTTLTDLISSVVQQPSAPPKFAGIAVQQPGKTSSRPIAVPETKPTTIEGWTVRDVADGKAVLEGPNGIWKVARGDTVPGVGTVDSIVRWGNRWIVATSGGLITTQ